MGISQRDHAGSLTGRLVILLLYLSVVASLYADDEIIRIKVEPENVVKGRNFTLTIYTSLPADALIDVREPELPRGIMADRGPEIRPYSETLDNGRYQKGLSIAYVFRAEKAGWQTIAGFFIRAGEKQIPVDPVLIGVGEYRNGKIVIPIDLAWKVSNQNPFLGETISIVLEAGTMEAIASFDEIKITSPAAGLFEKVTGLGRIKNYQYAGKTFYTIPIAGFLYTPTTIGKITLLPGEAISGGRRGKSEALQLNVLPPPDRIAATGAIGTFSVYSRLDKEAVTVNQNVVLYTRIEGSGNLGYLKIPEPIPEGMILLSKREDYRYIPSEDGYTGFREIAYIFEVSDGKHPAVSLPQFSWFDRRVENFFSFPGKKLEIELITPQETGNGSENRRVTPFVFKEIDDSSSFRYVDVYKKPGIYLCLLPGPVIFIILLVLKKTKLIGLSVGIILLGWPIVTTCHVPKPAKMEMKAGLTAFESQDFEKALSELKTILSRYPGNPDILFNIGVTYFYLNQPGLSVYYVRQAVSQRPMDLFMRQTLLSMESSLGLPPQPPLAYPIHPDFFLYSLIFCVNGASLSASILLFSKRSFLVNLTLLLLVLGLTAGGGMIAVKRSARWGVIVTEDVYMKKIPTEQAAEWFQLPEGTVLTVVTLKNDYIFVRTGYGVSGWIKKSKILLD
ncbi:MAG: hypothetical protein AB1798_17055 [Spirochaetota bacterium]